MILDVAHARPSASDLRTQRARLRGGRRPADRRCRRSAQRARQPRARSVGPRAPAGRSALDRPMRRELPDARMAPGTTMHSSASCDTMRRLRQAAADGIAMRACSARTGRTTMMAARQSVQDRHFLTSPVELPTLGPVFKLSVRQEQRRAREARVDSVGRRRSCSRGPRPPGPLRCTRLVSLRDNPGGTVHRRTRVCQPGRSLAS